MKFTKKKTQLMDGSVQFIYTQTGQAFPPFQVVATKEGVRFEGKSDVAESLEDLEALAKVISEAWKDHNEA